MRDSLWGELSECIDAGDLDGVMRLVEPLTAVERKQLSTSVAAAVSEQRKSHSHCACRVCDALALAEFAVCPPSKVRRSFRIFDHRYAGLLIARERPWRQAIVDRATANSVNQWARQNLLWQTAYELVRGRLIDRPKSSWYVATGCLAANIWRDDSDWLEHDFWRIFEVEDAAEILSSRTRACEAYAAERLDLPDLLDDPDLYPPALFSELAHSGIVPRDRMLDATLGALRRDFSAKSTLFYRRLFLALEPTVDERAERLDTLLALLSNDDVADVAFALGELKPLAEGGRLPARSVLEAVEPALAVPVKKHALAAVRLVGLVLDDAPDAAPLGVPVLIEALTHEQAEVQTKAFALIARHRSVLRAGDRERLGELIPDLDPGLRARVGALALEEAVDRCVAVDAIAVPGVQPIDPAAPRLAAVEALAPVNSADELLDRIEAELRWPWHLEEFELLLDAVLRLPAEAFDVKRAGRLVQWLRFGFRLKPPYTGFHSEGSLPIHWVLRMLSTRLGLPHGTDQRKLRSTGTLIDALSVRIAELLEQPRSYPGLLSVPTHAGGWIDPLVAVMRVATLTGPAPPVDFAQLLLRLPPDHRAEARKSAAELRTLEGAVLAYALGEDVAPPALPSRLEPAWAAARDARHPAAHHPSGYPPTESRSVRDRIQRERIQQSNRMIKDGLRVWRADPIPSANPRSLLELDWVWDVLDGLPGTWHAGCQAFGRRTTRRFTASSRAGYGSKGETPRTASSTGCSRCCLRMSGNQSVPRRLSRLEWLWVRRTSDSEAWRLRSLSRPSPTGDWTAQHLVRHWHESCWNKRLQMAENGAVGRCRSVGQSPWPMFLEALRWAHTTSRMRSRASSPARNQSTVGA